MFDFENFDEEMNLTREQLRYYNERVWNVRYTPTIFRMSVIDSANRAIYLGEGERASRTGSLPVCTRSFRVSEIFVLLLFISLS